MPSSQNAQAVAPFVLGIDLGANSLGWAIVAVENGRPGRLLRAGVRIFDAGMEGDIEHGREISRNQSRREARLHRRQLWRRKRRMAKLFRILQGAGLLPPSPDASPESRQQLLTSLDQAILSSEWFLKLPDRGTLAEPFQVLPYLLRARALDEPLPPFYVGRALYHLAQRRGFRSNRKESAGSRKEEEGQVKHAISELQAAITESGARTLGEYLSRLAPSKQRIRCRWTARDMYDREFESIWSAQVTHHRSLTPDLKKRVQQAIFFQRPLKIKRNLISFCELEPDQRRAPKYHPLAQRFRMLQGVNNLRLQVSGQPERELTSGERTELLAILDRQGDITLAKARKLLKFPASARFSIEADGEKVLIGNRTQAKFLEAFGERWPEMPEQDRAKAINDVNSIQNDEARRKRAISRWKLAPDAAQRFARIALEPDYFNLSRKAIQKLLPRLEQGIPYSTARRQLYPQKFEAREPLAFLPPVQFAIPELRNPAVMRSLTELRKVVNALIRQHGLPAEIRIELARDLRSSKKQRLAANDRIRQNEQLRKKAARRITDEIGIPNPTRDDIRKVLLADEANWTCPFTRPGRAISMPALFGSSPQFDFEHILPFSRSLDNSMANLTLCYNEENRHRKHNRTPYEAYAGEPSRYEEILQRVERFKSAEAREKLRRFQMNDEQFQLFLQDFSNRQLADTRYASRLAGDYLALLYGGRSDAAGTLRVRVSSGQTTAYLRAGWNLNGILDDGPSKNGGHRAKTRDDHRHHAVDAAVIALTNDGTIQQLSRAAERGPAERRRMFAHLEGPWPDFVSSVRAAVAQIVVSHRVSRKVSGPLHEETNYGRPPGGRTSRVRKPLVRLTRSEVENIADPGVRRRVIDKLAELGMKEPKTAFSAESNLPFLQASDGRRIVIKKARIEKPFPAVRIAKGPAERGVLSEMNHHVEIYAEIDKAGLEKTWDGEVVSMLEAYQRKQRGEPITRRDHGPLVQFKFSLAPGDVLECDDQTGGRRMLLVRSVSQSSADRIEVGLVALTDARLKAKIISGRGFYRPGPNVLRKWNTRKVAVSPLGEITEAHD
jgi:CRISPR-associated endonuclease Csn1